MITLTDLDANPWASCGPAALAALLDRPLAEIRAGFPHPRVGKTWTNFAMMDRALTRLHVKHDRTRTAWPHLRAKEWPDRGLVLIQFKGSWSQLPKNHPAQLQRSHWIAVSPLLGADGAPHDPPLSMVFDINLVAGLGTKGSLGWTTRAAWERHVAPVLAKSYGKTATGEWWVRGGLEVHDA